MGLNTMNVDLKSNQMLYRGSVSGKKFANPTTCPDYFILYLFIYNVIRETTD